MSTSVPELPWYLVGPHGFYDLVRLARRGRSVFVRVLYVLALFAALAVVYYNAEDGDVERKGGLRDTGRAETMKSINHNARIAERFCITILLMQNIAVLVLTPIYMAASIQEERDKRTFPLLFTTHLTARSIVLGKWLSRCAHVGTILLAGLPVLSFVQLWGGIDMPMIAANFCNTAMLLLVVGALGMTIAIRGRSLIRAVFSTYVILSMTFMCCWVPQGFLSGAFALLLAPHGGEPNSYAIMWLEAIMLTVVYGALTFSFLKHAGIRLERLRHDEGPRFERADWTGLNVPRNRFRRWPAFSENVIAWKERYLDQNITVISPYMFLVFVATLAVGYLSAWITQHSIGGPVSREVVTMHGVFKFVLLANFFIYLLLVAWRVTGSIVRERQQQTLEPLLTLPLSRREILNQKIVGNLQRQLGWLWPAALAALVASLFGHGHAWVVLLLAIVLAVHLAFFVAVAAYLTVHCRTIVSAYVSLGVIMLLIFVGTPIVFSFFGLPSSIQRGANPVYCWYTIADDWWRQGRPTAWAAIVEATLFYALAALALWRVAVGRLERDPV
jgi:ABC-type transport system involved in multi-copper enzyme maturation permease subunit